MPREKKRLAVVTIAYCVDDMRDRYVRPFLFAKRRGQWCTREAIGRCGSND